MTTFGDAEVAAIVAEQDRRWRELDPLIRPPPGPGRTDPARTVASVDACSPEACAGGASHAGGRDGSEVVLEADTRAGCGVARIIRSEVAEDDEASLWGALRSWRLRYHLSGDDRGQVLGELLDGFERFLYTSVPGDDPETTALVTLPSRDVELATPVSRHGFGATNVVAARSAPTLHRLDTTLPHEGPADDILIRPATLADLGVLAELAVGLNRFDSWFGGVTARPTAANLMAEALQSGLSSEPTWTWVAHEPGGPPLGLVQVEPPASATWIATSVAAPADRVAYVSMLFVRPDLRARGVGTRLVAEAHRALDQADVAVTLLHHSLPNPHSTPFWARQGYRPLWTAWQRRPVWRSAPR